MDHNIPPLLTLIGDEEENFYQLGVKDRENYSATFKHLKSLTSLNNQFIDLIIEETVGKLGSSVIGKSPVLYSNLKAYTDGLEINLNKFLSLFLFPEILSSLNKWIPGVNTFLTGCSSVFINHNDSPHHLRILDYPLVGSFDVKERMIIYKFKNRPQVLSFGSAGLPYPSLTAMNSEGITLALHQKCSNYFNLRGNSIFDICYKILMECSDLKSTLKLLKQHPSLTAWGINLSFKDGTVASIDIAGEQLVKKEYQISEHNYLYFNNMPIQHNNHLDQTIPYGLTNYCEMRTKSFNQQVARTKNKKIKPLEMLQLLSSPIVKKNKTAEEWNMSPLTISSVNIVAMNAKEGEALNILGPAPKFFNNSVLKLKSIWINPINEIIDFKEIKTSSKSFNDGFYNWARAQAELDKKNIHLAFHHIQIAIDHFSDTPEQTITKFFFLCMRYIHHKTTKDLGVLTIEFQAILDQLPTYLKDHNRLFIFRIEMLLFKKSNISENDFENEALKKVFLFEQKLKPFSLKLLRKLMIIRMETLDILYPYFKIVS
ncbi:MAG: hypothetical protein U0T83_03655 [Bacteriovoracaceae bacterium]